MPLTLRFHFGETPESGRDSGQKMSNPPIQSPNPSSSSHQILVMQSSNPISSGRQIHVLRMKNPLGIVEWSTGIWQPELIGFDGGANRIWQPDYKDLVTGLDIFRPELRPLSGVSPKRKIEVRGNISKP